MSYKDKVLKVLKKFKKFEGVTEDGQDYFTPNQALSEIEKIYDERFELCVPSDLTTVMRDIIRFRWKETRQGD